MACFDIPGDAALSPDRRTLLLTTGAPRVAQRLRVGIRTVLGTYKYDLAKGVPWFELLEKPNQILLRSAIYDFFLSHPEVSSVLNLEFRVDRLTRMMSVSYQLKMADGQELTGSSDVTAVAVSA
jgi:hypothetical protein